MRSVARTYVSPTDTELSDLNNNARVMRHVLYTPNNVEQCKHVYLVAALGIALGYWNQDPGPRRKGGHNMRAICKEVAKRLRDTLGACVNLADPHSN